MGIHAVKRNFWYRTLVCSVWIFLLHIQVNINKKHGRGRWGWGSQGEEEQKTPRISKKHFIYLTFSFFFFFARCFLQIFSSAKLYRPVYCVFSIGEEPLEPLSASQYLIFLLLTFQGKKKKVLLEMKRVQSNTQQTLYCMSHKFTRQTELSQARKLFGNSLQNSKMQ